MENKKCNRCNFIKPVDCFYKHKYGKFRVGTICIDCILSVRKDKYVSKKEFNKDSKLKRCSSCKEIKSKGEFRKHKSYYAPKCRKCEKDKVFEYNINKNYNISLDEYNNMLKNQNYKCMICKSDNGNRRLCVDHNHVNGEVRALLCDHCNTGLNKFKENINLLELAIKYLKLYEIPINKINSYF